MVSNLPFQGWSHLYDKPRLGGGLIFSNFHPYLGKIPILTNIFQVRWNHQLEDFRRLVFPSFVASFFEVDQSSLVVGIYPTAMLEVYIDQLQRVCHDKESGIW